MVGQGVSCTETADRILTRNQRNRFDCGAQLVGNWTEVLSPVVAAEFAENEWPETMVLDATMVHGDEPKDRRQDPGVQLAGCRRLPCWSGEGSLRGAACYHHTR